jgi:hypothetical protein
MRLALLSAVAKLLRVRFKVDGLCYGASAIPLPRVGKVAH